MPSDTPDRGRLRWQCRRGMLELDFVLERYLDEDFDTAGAVEQAQFADLLTAQDPELQAWLLNGNIAPDHPFAALVARIRRV